jgi:hypothetical protein
MLLIYNITDKAPHHNVLQQLQSTVPRKDQHKYFDDPATLARSPTSLNVTKHHSAQAEAKRLIIWTLKLVAGEGPSTMENKCWRRTLLT